MGKTGIFMLGVVWLAVWTYAGFRLTEKSFAWIEPAPAVQGAGENAPAAKPSPLTNLPKNAAEAEAWYRSLTPKQQQCLADAIGQERVAAAMKSGAFKPTAQEAVKVAVCLK